MPDNFLEESLLNFTMPSVEKKDSPKKMDVEKMGTPADIILNNAVDTVLQILDDGTILRANPIATVNLDYTEKQLQKTNLYSLILPEYHNFLKSRIADHINQDKKRNLNKEEDLFLLRCWDGRKKIKTFEGVILPYSEKEKTTFFLNLWEPESTSNKLVDQLKEARNNYESLSETISEAVIIIDDNFKIIYANSATIRVFGYEKQDIIGKPFEMLFPEEIFYRYSPEIRKYFYIDFNDRENANITGQLELLGRNKNRGVSPIEISFGNSREFQERTLTCIIRDVSHRKNVERKLRYLAYHDKLTELGNRDLFATDIANLFELFKKNHESMGALFFLDLDGFKQVNDTFGHQVGDLILIETTQRLRNTLRESDLIYRFGGDEFVVLLPKITQQKDAELVATKILSEISKTYSFEKNGTISEASIGVSIGIALIPFHGNNNEIVTRNADLAMYSAKDNGKNRFVVFSEDLTHLARSKWTIEQGLKTALVRQEMFLQYQPLLSREREIVGVEALIRWRHPDLGIIPPDDFIPAAEENGNIIPIGHWVLKRACMEIHKLNKELHKDFFVAVNLSTKQLNLTDFPELIEGVINRTSIKPGNLKLEITESFLMENPEMVVQNLYKVKSHNPELSFVIDDFGKGYSSLSYLTRLPVDCIKIDRSFIKEIPEENNMKLIKSIVNLAKSLNLSIVAEGIETEEQQQNETIQNCQYFQGYLHSKAIDLVDLKNLLLSP
ncbi:MAG: hypothetical protein B6241_12040 [Spirochaetaceae bacterium 4572_59]|nr:MAG: hypothetical protein B6241_12040 [Spirochaetaceae bacterium 4572_59]